MTAEKNPFAKFLTHFDNGQVLFHEGDDGDDMYIIQSGRVAIKKKVKDGETTLAVLEKGDFFGEMAILERLPRSATRGGGRGGRPHRHQRRDVRGHDQGQPRDRRAHAAQAVDPAARDEPAARAGPDAGGARCPRAAAADAAPAAAPRHRGHAAGRGDGLLHLRRPPATSSPSSATRRSSAASTPSPASSPRSTSPTKTRAATSRAGTRAS